MTTRATILLRSTLATLALAMVATVGCASAEIGEDCGKSGSKDECVAGAICTQLSSGDNVCRANCDTDADCGANEKCNGVSGANTKSCQPK